MTKFFKIKKKINLFFGHFCPKEIFPKNYGYVQLQESPAFKYQRYRVDWSSNKKLFITINMQKSFNQSAQFIKSLVRYT